MKTFIDVLWATTMFGVITVVVLLLMMHMSWGGWFGKDKIEHDKVVEDTLALQIPDSEYVVVQIGDEEYIVKAKKFKECVVDNEVIRKEKPIPRPIYTPTPFDNKPKE